MPLTPLIDPANRAAYVACVADLLVTPQVQSMRSLPHHPGVNCFEHSIFVSYQVFRCYAETSRCHLFDRRTAV